MSNNMPGITDIVTAHFKRALTEKFFQLILKSISKFLVLSII